MEYNFIQKKFRSYNRKKQLMVYSLALRNESYELLEFLNVCIEDKDQFLIELEELMLQNYE